MNVPSQMAGNIPNQGGTSRMVQQNGSVVSGSGGMIGSNMNNEFLMVRRTIQGKITQYIQGNAHIAGLMTIPEISKHIDTFLLKNAPTEEDYMNQETLDIRIQTVVRNLINYQSRRPTASTSVNSMMQTPGGSNIMQTLGGSNMMQTPRGSTMIPTPGNGTMIPTPGSGTMIPTPGSGTMIPTPGSGTMIPTPGSGTMIPTPGSGTMIPTPGMSRSSNTNITVSCSADNSVIVSSGSGTLTATPVGSVNMLQASNGAASIGHRSMHDSYQLPTSKNSFSSVSPMGLSQHYPSQMIPTPGLNNLQSSAMNSVCNGSGYSGVDSTVVSQQQQQHLQKQSVGNQNIRILQNLGGQMGMGLRSNIPHRYGFSNGGLTGRGNNQQLMNGSVVSEAYMSSPAYNNSQKPMQQHLDHQLQQSLRPRDGFGMNNMTGNLYVNNPSGGSAMNHPNMNSLNRSKMSTTSQNYQLNLQSNQQQIARNSSFVDHSQKFQSHPGRENLLQATQQFPTQTSQPSAQFVQNQFQPQKQLSLENDPFQQPFLASGLGAQVIHEQGIDSINEPLNAQASQEFRLPELTGYAQSNMIVSSSLGTKLAGQLPASQNPQPSISQDSQKIHQIFDHNQPAVESLNNFNSLSNGCQSNALLTGQWHRQTLEKHHLQNQTSLQQHSHNDFPEPLTAQADEKHTHFSTEVPGPTSSVANGLSVTKPSDIVSSNDVNALRAVHFTHQQKWILLMIHSRHCSFPVGKCKDVYCSKVQDLWLHMIGCNADDCKHPRCKKSKKLIEHFSKCQVTDCPTCVPVRIFIRSKHKTQSCDVDRGEMNGSWKTVNAVDAVKSIETSEEMQASKRVKVEHPSFKNDAYSTATQQVQIQAHPLTDSVVPMDCEAINTNTGPIMSSGPENLPNMIKCNINDSDNMLFVPGECRPKLEAMEMEKDSKPPKFEIKQDITAPSVDHIPATKSGKPKIKGVSMTELFTPELVQIHITGLRQWVGQSKAKAEKNQAMEHSMSENSCQLCAIEKLTFEPPPIYCSICGARIKRNAMYYTCGSSDTRQYLCIPCHNEARGDTVEVEGTAIVKSKFEKKKNDVEIEESWVQCDKCEAWQHQICTLFNGRRNEGGQAEYICPKCYVDDVNNGIRKPLPQSSVLGADDLPKTLLSDHLEQRLFRRLKQDRQERAMSVGKSYDEVPGAESLVVRVVSSVDKKLDVKQRFLEIFQEDNYPKEFAYKSKVVLLFQKIEGVEVCLFGMYVQEFGSECAFPNQRRVYLSYLDSVKYFRPEIKTASGEALRTFVYHEILIGYLEYCKMRGFTSCYIWACPPLKGEDYILYCHPEIQKTPKSDKLREWYLSMLRKAMKENIVVDLTNLYDHFFVTTGECKAKVTAARLPYFDGDYWPGAAEDMINLLQQEEDGRRQQKKGKTKKTITKRALKAAGHTDLSGNASKDALLMQKLGETISPMKEDFIMVHLQHACTHCCILMVSGIRWVCNHCKNFQLCERCYDAEQKREEREKHPINSREKHHLNPVAITDVSPDTKDNDEILESEFFDTRQAFLSLCQGNHYQYDTLRRAKHSSMMVLYHLHNPTAPAFVTTCNVCHHDIETGQGWRCEVCPDFDVCTDCYKKDGGVDHPHKLTNHPSMVDAQNTEARQKRVAQLRRMLNLLVHASQCRGNQSHSSQCQYPDCCKVKGLFRHGRVCKTRMSGGCLVCKRMWYLLQIHSRTCKDPECYVPRCRDLREHLRRSQQQSESRRRAAVNEMMRQRAAEVAGSS